MKEKMIKDVTLIVCDHFVNESIGNAVVDYNTVYEILYNSFGFLFDLAEGNDDE